MKIACFDSPSGAAGDMILASLVDAGLPVEPLREALLSLSVPPFGIETSRCLKNGIRATTFRFVLEEEKSHRHLKEIVAILESSGLPEGVKERSTALFRRLAEAEAHVHGVGVEEVHFHEVGALDSILDIVGAVTALDLLGVEKVYATPPSTGTGEVKTAHGIMPVPSPATARLLQGRVFRRKEIRGELLTPTGALLLAGLTDSFRAHPAMRLDSIGYGAGSADFPSLPNVLRVMIGESEGTPVTERIALLETDIDHLPPEIVGGLYEKLLSSGALDVSAAPVMMKKNRPGLRITVLARPHDGARLASLLLVETGSLGVRLGEVDRIAVERVEVKKRTRYGTVRFKKGIFPGGKSRVAPEYDDCAAIAKEKGLSIREVWEAVCRDGGED